MSESRERETRSVTHAQEPAPSERSLAAYDAVRERVARALARDDGRAGVAEVLLAVPDVLILLIRLTLDNEVPGKTRAVVGAALAYFLVPTDLWPEVIVGGLGYADDVVLATAVLAHSFGNNLEHYAARHWSGSGELREALGKITGSARRLLSSRLDRRLSRTLARKGVEL